MCFLVEELRVVDQCQDVDQDAVVRLLVKVTLFVAMILIDNQVDGVKEGRHEVVLADCITGLSVFHQRDEAEVQKALNISIDYSVIWSLGLPITEVQSSLHAELNH